MNVLILEDDNSLRMAFADALEESGYSVVLVASVDDACRQLETSRFDLLLLDLLIANGTSLAVARMASYAAPDADVIVVTGSDHYPNGELLRSSNVSWILRKPVSMSDLIALVQYSAHRRETQRTANIFFGPEPRRPFGGKNSA